MSNYKISIGANDLPVQQRNSSGSGYSGPSWFYTMAEEMHKAESSGASSFEISMENVKRVTLFDWIGALALIDRIMSLPTTREVTINLKSSAVVNLPSPEKQKRIEDQIRVFSRKPTTEEQEVRNIYRVAGFMESIGTSDLLNASHRTTRFSYLWLGIDGAQFKAYYRRKYATETIFMGGIRIAQGNKEHCRQFLDPSRIAMWRTAMESKFRDSPLLKHGELWRVFCHELAANVYEHSESSGFLSARILQSASLKEDWCRASFQPEVVEVFNKAPHGILELCISDAGSGFVATLEKSYRLQAKVSSDTPIIASDVLAFAFDEFGTCKEKSHCWATGRHALGRLLQIIGQYGGAITVRSGGAEVLYVNSGEPFKRRYRHLGYEPQKSRATPLITGTHIQVVLPLYPLLPTQPTAYNKSILIQHLPQSFRVDNNHVRGHLVPIKDRLRLIDQPEGADVRAFRRKCEVLARELSSRSRVEPLIFDFSDLEWSPPEFETFVHLMQNLLHDRPVLLVELESDFLRAIIQLEDNEENTKLSSDIADDTPSVTGAALSHLTVSTFLESVRTPLLAIDSDGTTRILGLPERKFEAALLRLIGAKQTIGEIATYAAATPQETLLILKGGRPLFEVAENNRWTCSWSNQDLSIQSRRAMNKHFVEVAKRCDAWHKAARKKSEIAKGRTFKGSKYNLPWLPTWREDFFQASRILVRQRHADEVAQRLIHRLEYGCRLMGTSLDKIGVLACMTAPAILLANAIGRWWPTEKPPAIADLGPYVMLSPDAMLPTMAVEGEIVIVQDVIDDHRRSGRLQKLLQHQGKKVLCAISLVKLVQSKIEEGVTNINEGWLETGLPCHSFIQLRRPKDVSAAPNGKDAFWIEPRTLRPFAYSLLRRASVKEGLEGRPKARFFPSEFKEIVAPGHFVYGQRHFSVVLDIKRAVDGVIGDAIAKTIAEICVDDSNRVLAPWESTKAQNFKGEVTMVLMPLHSQVQYLWNKVELELAERDKRVLAAYLDATLFLGSGPAYRLPLQLVQQIEDSVKAVVATPGKKGNRIRLLVVDDSTFTGRTMETILAEVDRAIEKACRDFGMREIEQGPVEWIRYINMFNQMPFAKYVLWNNLDTIGRVWKVKFLLDEFWWITGLPVFEEDNCPFCNSIKRLNQLENKLSAVLHASSIREWIAIQKTSLAAVAVESPGYHVASNIVVDRPINLLLDAHDCFVDPLLIVDDIGLAILRFHELLYLAYPPSEIIPCAKQAWCSSDNSKQTIELERFRWHVLQWCICNWPRLIADSARTQFKELVATEVLRLSPITVAIFEGIALHFADEIVEEIVGEAIRVLAALEKVKASAGGADAKASRGNLKLLLFDCLIVYFFGIPTMEANNAKVRIDGGVYGFLEAIERYAQELNSRDNMCFLQLLHLAFTRPRRFANPGWALRTLSETVFRGRVAAEPSKHGHMLLPKLLNDAMKLSDEPDTLALLGASLSLFTAALDDLVPFAYQVAQEADEVKIHVNAVIAWLDLRRRRTVLAHEVPQPHLRALCEDHLGIGGKLSILLQEHFNPTLNEIENTLRGRIPDMINGGQLDLLFEATDDVKADVALIDKMRFCHFLSNWLIEPIRKVRKKCISKISVRRHFNSNGGPELEFRLLTSFDSLTSTQEMTMRSKHAESDLGMLKLFGARVKKRWGDPTQEELELGLTCCYEVMVPIGFRYQ